MGIKNSNRIIVFLFVIFNLIYAAGIRVDSLQRLGDSGAGIYLQNNRINLRDDSIFINSLSGNNLTFINSISKICTTSISYGVNDRTTFPELIYFDSLNEADGIVKLGSENAVYISVGAFPDPDSGAYLLLEGYNDIGGGNYVLNSAWNGSGWLKAPFHYWTYGGDTAEVKLVPLTSENGSAFGCSQTIDTLNVHGGAGIGTGIELYGNNVHIIDTTLSDKIKVGSGSVIAEIKLDNNPAGQDTLKITVSGRTWFFLPTNDPL